MGNPFKSQPNALGQAAASSATLPQGDRPPANTRSTSAPDPRGAAGAVARPELHREDRSRAYADGHHAKPTKGSLQDRQGSPSGAGYTTSGIDAAMQKLADREHRRVFKGRR